LSSEEWGARYKAGNSTAKKSKPRMPLAPHPVAIKRDNKFKVDFIFFFL
jgi:hypothetical protein